MLPLIKTFVFVGNLIFLVILDIYLWTWSWCVGIGGIIGITAFFIGYSISGGISISKWDTWQESEFGIFKKKLAYGNGIAGTTIVVSSIIIYSISEFI